MTITKIQSILTDHCVPCYIVGGRIYADSMEAGTDLFQTVEDLTDFTLSQLRLWLGY